MKRVKTSRHKGVSKFKNHWRARFKNYTIGIFKTEAEALKAYKNYTKEITGICRTCNTKLVGKNKLCPKCHPIRTAVNRRLRQLGLNKDGEIEKALVANIFYQRLQKGTIEWNDPRVVKFTESIL